LRFLEKHKAASVFSEIPARQISAHKLKPIILVIFGYDVGMWNVGAYSDGMMGRTPNVDRIAKEGMLFTDHYAHSSCTAGMA